MQGDACLVTDHVKRAADALHARPHIGHALTGRAFRRIESDAIIADLDLDLIEEVRKTWQFFRDRRPDSYMRISEF